MKKVKIGFLIFCLLVVSPKVQGFEIDAKAAFLLDVESNTILYEKNPDQRLAPASITKIMTAYLTLEDIKKGKIKLEDKAMVSEYAASMEEVKYYLKPKDEVSIRELLKTVMVISANDSSVVLAETLEKDNAAFILRMNKKAKELGMNNTRFMNANGLPDGDDNPSTGHYMSARDIGTLARNLLKEYPEILEYSRIKEIDSVDRKNKRSNTNKLLKEAMGIDGLKTGYTNEAGYCLLSTWDITKTNSDKEPFRLVAVILGAKGEEERVEESKKLLLYGKENFEKNKIIEKGNVFQKIRIPKAKDLQYDLEVKEDVYALVSRNTQQSFSIQTTIFPEEELLNKKKGEEVGKITIRLPEKKTMEVSLITRKDILPANFFVVLYREIRQKIQNSF